MRKFFKLLDLRNRFSSWTPYNATVENITYNYKWFYYRRVWDCMDITGKIEPNANASGIIKIYIPNDFTIDYSSFDDDYNWITLGYANAWDGAVHYTGLLETYNRSGSGFKISNGLAAGDSWGAGVPIVWAAGDSITIHLTGIPIKEWALTYGAE